MSQRDREIGLRVKKFRESIKWSQSEFAKALGIGRDQLANIEYGRAPLRVSIGSMICRIFDVNGEWLATGSGKSSGGSPGLTAIQYEPAFYDLFFADAYDRNPEIFISPGHGPKYPLEQVTPGFDPQSFLIKEMLGWFHVNSFKKPLDAENFARDVADYAQQYLKDLRSHGVLIRMRKAETEKQVSLDIRQNDINNADVKARIQSLPDLIKAIRDRVTERGQKTALANELNVSRQAVDQWLSGDAKPSADLTFKLLNWVESH